MLLHIPTCNKHFKEKMCNKGCAETAVNHEAIVPTATTALKVSFITVFHR
jgi:hypothetical protein